MRILIAGLNYAPELIGVGKYTREFAVWLASHGHDVQVVTGHPYYPQWRVRTGYCCWRFRRERRDGVEVLRCPLWVPRSPTVGRRLLHLASFALSSFVPIIWQALRFRPDVVLAIEPTLCSTPAAVLAARLVGARAGLHVQDLEIEAALRLGMLRRPLLKRTLHAAYRWTLRRFDLVSTLSTRMRARLAAAGVPDERLCVFPNWVDTKEVRPLETPSPLREALGIRRDRVVALYAGTMGTKQGLDGFVEAAERLAGRPDVHVVMCGSGPVRRTLLSRLHDQPNVTFLPLQPPARLNELLNLADIHLLPQRAGVSAFALPSKLGPMLASGRPVIAQCDERCEVCDVVEHCGIVVPPEDPAAMARAIVELARDPGGRRRLGETARGYAATHLDRDRVIADYERRLLALTARPVRAAPEATGQWAG